jgi:hypothetical protein
MEWKENKKGKKDKEMNSSNRRPKNSRKKTTH